MRRAMRRSLKTVQGIKPALRPRLPSSSNNAFGAASCVGVMSAKHTSWKNPVGEYLEATVGYPHAFVGVPEGTMSGRGPLESNWKLSLAPVRMLNGLPEATSIMGATVQLLKNFDEKLSPPSLPLSYTPLKTNRCR